MDLVGSAVRMTSRGMVAALLVLLAAFAAAAPATAEDDGPAPAGVTVSGIGVARTGEEAAERAMRDARSRAAAIARVLRIDLGRVESVELPEVTQFERSHLRCGHPDSIPTACREAAVVTATFAVVGGATADGSRGVGSSATASVEVEPRNKFQNRSIRRAILGAREQATREAAVGALSNARQAAAVSGLQLGPVFSVAEEDPDSGRLPAFLEGSSFEEALGAWGPGTFCKVVRRPVIRRDPVTGESEVRRIKQRRCATPSTYEVRLAIRYSAL